MTFSNGKEPHSEYEPETWREELIARVGDCLMAQGLMGPIAWQSWQEADLHHLLLYPRTVRFIGGT